MIYYVSGALVICAELIALIFTTVRAMRTMRTMRTMKYKMNDLVRIIDEYQSKEEEKQKKARPLSAKATLAQVRIQEGRRDSKRRTSKLPPVEKPPFLQTSQHQAIVPKRDPETGPIPLGDDYYAI